MSSIQSLFSENGYYLAKGVYDSSQLPGMQDDFDRNVQQLLASKENINARWGSQLTRELEDTDSVVYHTHNVQCYSAIWLQALLNPDFLDVAEEILGSDVVLHHTKLFQKPPNQGAAFPIHQDWQYFPTLQDTMIAGIIHLTEATDHMGCIRVYLGSHYLGRQSGLMGNGENRVSTSRDIFFGRGHRNRSRNWGGDLFSLFHLTEVKTQPIKPDKKNSVGTSTQWRRLSLKMKIHTPMLSWYYCLLYTSPSPRDRG